MIGVTVAMVIFVMHAISCMFVHSERKYENYLSLSVLERNLSITITSMIKFIACDLFSNVF